LDGLSLNWKCVVLDKGWCP